MGCVCADLLLISVLTDQLGGLKSSNHLLGKRKGIKAGVGTVGEKNRSVFSIGTIHPCGGILASFLRYLNILHTISASIVIDRKRNLNLGNSILNFIYF